MVLRLGGFRRLGGQLLGGPADVLAFGRFVTAGLLKLATNLSDLSGLGTTDLLACCNLFPERGPSLLGLRELVLELSELLLGRLHRLLQGCKLGLSRLAGLVELAQLALRIRHPGMKVGQGSCCPPLLIQLASGRDLFLLDAGRFSPGFPEPASVGHPEAESQHPAQDGHTSEHKRQWPPQLGAVIEWHNGIP